jgi:hypothetical protein
MRGVGVVEGISLEVLLLVDGVGLVLLLGVAIKAEGVGVGVAGTAEVGVGAGVLRCLGQMMAQLMAPSSSSGRSCRTLGSH